MGYVEQTLRRDRNVGTVTRALGTATATKVVNDPTFSALGYTLALLERTGRDPAESLRQAARRHEIESARSVAKVLNHRLELISAAVGPSERPQEGPTVHATRVPPTHQHPRGLAESTHVGP